MSEELIGNVGSGKPCMLDVSHLLKPDFSRLVVVNVKQESQTGNTGCGKEPGLGFNPLDPINSLSVEDAKALAESMVVRKDPEPDQNMPMKADETLDKV